MENFGNTCYANSVLQALYFCQPFRRRLLEYAQSSPCKDAEESLLTCLADLFVQVCCRMAVSAAGSPACMDGHTC